MPLVQVSGEVTKIQLLPRDVVSSLSLVRDRSGGKGSLFLRSLTVLLSGLVSLTREPLHRAGGWLLLEKAFQETAGAQDGSNNLPQLNFRSGISPLLP